MSYLNKIKASLQEASKDTSNFMSVKLQNEAIDSGWPTHVAKGMHVKYSDGEFHVHSHPDHKKEVLNLEYGTPSTRPTAAIRRFSNRQSEAEHFLVNRAFHHLRSL